MKIAAVIPARLESTRLPGKSLCDIAGMPMVIHTCLRTAMSQYIDEVYLATDSHKIRSVAEGYGVKVIMTSPDHSNGSERTAEAAKSISADVIVNVQGDEPLVYPQHISQIVYPFIRGDQVDLTIGVTQFSQYNSPGDIKAVMNEKGEVMYCSRNDIPCYYQKDNKPMWKLCFIVPCLRELAIEYASWSPTELDLIEDNHFIRFLENGKVMQAVEIEGAKISVDTQEDLVQVRALMEKDRLKNEYLPVDAG